MKKKQLWTPALLVGLCLSASAVLGDAPHWGYSGHEGPEHWGDLDPKFAMCAAGKNQSPVNLTEMIEGELPEIAFNYLAAAKRF